MPVISNSGKNKHAGGRPTLYCKELADLICDRVATHTLGLRALCKKFGDMPNPDTIHAWRLKYNEFSDSYAKAKLKQADLIAEEILEIADDASNDWMEITGEKTEGWKLNGEHVQRSRLRVDTRKWLASKLLPKQYGAYAEEKESSLSVIEMLLKQLQESK